MGGIGDFFFGLTDQGGYTGNAPLLTPGQGEILDQLTKLLSGQIGQGVSAYPGQIVPGASNLQSQGFDLIQQLLGGGGLMGTAQDAIGKIMAGPGGGAFDPESATRFWETSVKAPAIKTWQEDILPGVRESFIGQNAGRSGAANRAIAKSGSDLASSLQASLGDILYQGEQSQLNRLLNIPGLATQTAMTPIQTALSAGQIQRGITGEQLQEPYQKWQAEQGYNNPWLNMLSTVLGTKAFEPIVQGPSSQSGFLQDALIPLLSAGLTGGKMTFNPSTWW